MSLLKGRRPMVFGERGVAMVTVLLIGAALTVVTSTATFLTIQEFRAGNADRTSTQALSYAEAGLDRMIQVVKTTPWSDLLLSGCPAEDVIAVDGSLGAGTFSAEVIPQENHCAAGSPDPFEPQFVDVVSEGGTGNATRTVQQTLRIVSGGLPIGVYAYDFVTASGGGSAANAPKFDGISLVTQGNVSSRDKLSFSGFDPWLTQRDVYGTGPDTSCIPSKVPVCDVTNSLPAAVHAGGIITCDAASTCSSGPNQKTEHVGSPDTPAFDLACDANQLGTTGQSAWDGSSKGGPIDSTASCAGSSVGKAPTSLFTVDDAKDLAPDPTPDKIDFDALEAAARDEGVYCTLNSAGAPMCDGASNDLKITQGEVNALPEDHVMYFDFPASSPQNVDWQAVAGDCENDRTTVVVIRNGGIDINGKWLIAGAILATDGTVLIRGGGHVHGTIIARTVDARGDSTFRLDECAIEALTAPFINVTPGHWAELDRLN